MQSWLGNVQCKSPSRFIRSLLRSTTFSTASGKEGIFYLFFNLFMACQREVEQRSVFG